MRRGLGGLLATAVLLVVPAAGASAGQLPAEFTQSCPTGSAEGGYGGVRICSGIVPSFDGSKLDVDVTQPMPGTGSATR